MNGKIISLIVMIAAIVASLASQLSVNDDDGRQPCLLLGTNVWPGYEPFYLARSLGYLDETSVRLVECSSASQVLMAFRNGTIDAAALTLDEVLLLKERGHDLQVILVTDISHGGDVILAKAEVQRLSDLRGRSVGVEHTALGAYVLARALQQAGISVADVNIVPLEVDEQEPAFIAGEVDAVVTFDPVRSRLLAAGANQLFDSTQLEGEIVDVLAIRAQTLANNSDKVDRLLRGWFRAVAFFNDNPDEAARHMVGRLKLPPADILTSYDGMVLPDWEKNILLLSGTQPPLADVAERLANVMRQEKLLQGDIDVTGLFSTEPLKRLNK